jgi:hypothetical protein
MVLYTIMQKGGKALKLLLYAMSYRFLSDYILLLTHRNTNAGLLKNF